MIFGYWYSANVHRQPLSPFAQLLDKPRFQARSLTRKTVIGGHGVVILPGNAPVNTEDGQETRKIAVGGLTYQVVAGVDTTIDGVPAEEYTPIEDSVEQPEQSMSAGKAAAIAFAEAAERIQREREQVEG